MKSPSRKSPGCVLKQYHEGRTTPTGLILETLELPVELMNEVLAAFPNEVQAKLSSFAEAYTPDTVIINGPRPREGAILHAREWLSRRGFGREQPLLEVRQASTQVSPAVTDRLSSDK